MLFWFILSPNYTGCEAPCTQMFGTSMNLGTCTILKSAVRTQLQTVRTRRVKGNHRCSYSNSSSKSIFDRYNWNSSVSLPIYCFMRSPVYCGSFDARSLISIFLRYTWKWQDRCVEGSDTSNVWSVTCSIAPGLRSSNLDYPWIECQL